MNSFPQLQTGTSTHFPLNRRRTLRTIQTTTPGGSTSTYFDDTASTVSWRLSYRSLTLAEWNRLEDFFQEMQGRLKPFTFLDPADNLLASSQDLTAGVWQAAGAFGAVAGVDDPFGGTKAFRVSSSGQSGAGVRQSVTTGSPISACLSAWLRGSAGSRVQMSGGLAAAEVTLGGGWRRLALTLSSGSSDSIQIAIGGSGTSTFDIYGLQLEAQPAPSAYKPTYGPGGVYLNARFDQDELAGVIDGPDSIHTEVRIVASMQGEQ